MDADATVLCAAALHTLRDRVDSSVTELILAIQRAQVVDDDARLPFAAATVMSDGTQLEVFLSNAATEKYSRTEVRPRGPAIVNSFVQLQHMWIPGGGFVRSPISTEWPTAPIISEDEKGSTLAASIFAPPSIFTLLWPVIPYLRYLLLLFSQDNAGSNDKGCRIILQHLYSQMRGLTSKPQILMWRHRCDGHQGGIMLRGQIKMSNLLSFAFSLAHLIRKEATEQIS